MAAEHLVVAGKSGTGVSTTAVNLSAALAEQGYRVAHLGYDPRRVSGELLRRRTPMKAACANACKGPCNHTRFHCATGVHDILCIECGLDGKLNLVPEYAALGRLELMARFRPDFVVHDIAGEPETVLPFLCNYSEPTRLFVITTADFAALTTLNQFLDVFGSAPPDHVLFGGIISNNLSGPFCETVVTDFSKETGGQPLVSIPHSLMVAAGEFSSMTVLESAPRSQLGSVYRKLARIVAQGLEVPVHRALPSAAFALWQQKWGEISEELDLGMVRDGAATDNVFFAY